YTFAQQNATAGAGFTSLSFINGDLDEYLIQPAAGPIAATFTQTPDNWFALMATFRAAVADTQPPSAPTNLVANGGLGSVGLTWGAASDNVGVTQYNVYRSTTSGFTPSSTNLIGTSATTSYTDFVAAGTYFYLVTAQDAAGNVSSTSNQATG